MGDSCEKQLAMGVINGASTVMARPSSSRAGKWEADGCILGIRWEKT